MNEYRATINLPECARGETASFPETPRTAVLVAQGILMPVVHSITERTPDVPWYEPDTLAPTVFDHTEQLTTNNDDPVVVEVADEEPFDGSGVGA